MTKTELLKYVDENIEDYDLKSEDEKEKICASLIEHLKDFSKDNFPNSYKGKMFILISQPNDQGFSRAVSMDELTAINTHFKTTNGGDWNRSNQSYLGKIYEIKRPKAKGCIAAIKLDGFNKNRTIKQTIKKSIKDAIESQKCRILYISSNVECDHKDGMKDDWLLNDINNQSLKDFQPLSKAANDAKRTHCIRCKETGKRFDAKLLGYSESFTMGDFDTTSCPGCYWYDPFEFNKKISEKFIKKG